MTLVHRIKRVMLEAGGEIDWSRIDPLRLNHVLWLDVPAPDTEVRVAYTDEALHARFRVDEASPTVRHLGVQVPVYKDSCVEWFLQPLPEGDGRYVNFEWNAAGSLKLAIGTVWHDRTDVPGVSAELFRLRAATDLQDERGTFWTLQFTIPFAWLQSLYPGFRPAPGCRMRGNFFKCGDETPMPHYRSWNKVTSATPDFHRSVDFGELVLE